MYRLDCIKKKMSNALQMISLEGKWTESTYPRHFPGRMARWSPLIGSSHSKDYIVWQFGGMASPGVTKVSEWGAVEMLEKEMKNQGEKVLRLALKDEVCTKCYRRTVNILLSVFYFLSPSVSTVRSSQYHRIIFLEPIKNRDCFRHCVNASGSQLQVLFSEVLSSFSCTCTSQAIGIIRGLFFCNFFKML